jgi:broad specificity phosphatase PhoE
VTRILIVRHCESEANEAGLFEGRGDSPLTARGREQAQRLAASLSTRELGVVRIVSSHQIRANTTARAIADALKVADVHVERDLREGDPGTLEGKLIAELGKIDETTTGGETIEVISTRAVAGFDRVHGAAPCDTLIIVSHGFTISMLVRRLFTGSPHRPKHLVISNGDFIEFVLDGEAVAGPPVHTVLEVV